jgi:hypothetical protein
VVGGRRTSVVVDMRVQFKFRTEKVWDRGFRVKGLRFSAQDRGVKGQGFRT